jgi:hypothetical protein
MKKKGSGRNLRASSKQGAILAYESSNIIVVG